jgi:mono/diheme cytochrome c family protein
MMKYLVIVLSLLVIGCQSHRKQMPASADSSMRHGWTVFTGPKRTVLGVNDLDSIERGKTVYMNHCVGCHGESGAGNGEVAKSFGIQPANLKALAKATANHYLVIQINNGKGNMPQWQDLLTARQTWDVTNYIQTLGGKN